VSLGARNSLRINQTHVENLKDPSKVLLPSGDLVLIALRKDEPVDCISLTLFIELPLNSGHDCTIERLVSESLGVRIAALAHFGQISNRVKDGLVEFFQSSPLQSPVERLTYTGAGLPKIDVILIVGHRVLDGWMDGRALEV
jgi:hypothetical protein